MEEDPIYNFFTSKEVENPKILYNVLSLESTATGEDIRKAYRKKALLLHPDKHTSKGEEEKEKLSREFQKVGFAYAVLNDDNRRKKYDSTGRTDDNFSDAEEMGWEAYFEQLFERIDGQMLDADRAKYQGSEEEVDDLIEAYEAHEGSLPAIMKEIPHSQHNDEPRFIEIINGLISSKTLKSTSTWKKTSTDEMAKAKRAKKATKEAKEAEAHAKELGVWDEFYGNGKKGKRKSDSDATAEGNGGDGEDALAALILKRQKDREGGLDRLAAKYAKIEEEERAKKKGKKGKKNKVDEEQGTNVGSQEISDADFEALQAKVFGAKDKAKKTKSK